MRFRNKIRSYTEKWYGMQRKTLYKNRGKLVGICLFFFAVLALQMLSFPLVGFASDEQGERQTVRVGVFQSPAYYGTNDSGEEDGYGYAYLRELAAVSNLRFEFVTGTKEEHLTNLQNGSIDLLDTIPYTPEYEQMFLYSNLPTFMSSGTLNTLSSNTNYTPNDYAGFEGIRVGAIENGTRTVEFEQWAREQGFGYTITYYESGVHLLNALLYHEVDAIVSEDIYYDMGQTVLASFNAELSYFITAHNNDELMQTINTAMSTLQSTSPQLRAQLSEEYFGTTADANALTEQEHTYLELNNATPLRVVYDSEDMPFEYLDTATGEASGLSVDVFSQMMQTAGITYELTHELSEAEALDALANGEADLMLSHSSASQLENEELFCRSVPYLDVPVTIVGTDDNLNEDAVFALDRGSTRLFENYLHTHFPDNEVVYFDTIQECYDAVKNGSGVFTADNVFEASHTIQSDEYAELTTLPTRLTESFSLLYGPETDEILIQIVDKSIRNHGIQLGESALLSHVSSISGADTINEWWLQNGPFVLGAAAFFLLLVVVCLSYLLERQKRLRKELWDSAYVDPLTKMPNLRLFKKEAVKKLSKHKDKKYLAILVDFNQFSLINDIYGQDVGNEILIKMGEALNLVVKPESDCVARLRADNFLLLYAHDPELAVDDLHERDAGLVFAYMSEHVTHHISYCIGRYQVPLGETDIDDIFEKVNYAHSQAKKGTSGEVVIDYEENAKQRALRNRYLEEKMHVALTDEEYLVYLQPKYNLKTGNIVGAETLVRWKDNATGELINPGEFIPLFEQNGFVMKLDFYMFEKVCKLLAQRLEDGLPVVPISVNFSRLHLQNTGLVEHIASLADQYSVPRHLLEIELVESTVVENEEVLETVLKELHEFGFTLSIDDFGTGYSSLGLLKNLPVDIIKIDRSFFANNRSEVRAKTVIANVVRMAKELSISTVAEGVETQAHVNFLRGLGCESVQGFYFSRPVPVQDFNWGDVQPLEAYKTGASSLKLNDLGDLSKGRSNLGEMMPVMVHRQFEFSVREVLEVRYGERETVEILREAGKVTGEMYAEGYLNLDASFDDFIEDLQLFMLKQSIGELIVEDYNPANGKLTVSIVDDLSCSGVSDTRRTICHYEEGFLAGIMQRYTQIPYTALEVDCWANGAELCRFKVRPNSDSALKSFQAQPKNIDDSNEE